jgi:hypothetical protein
MPRVKPQSIDDGFSDGGGFSGGGFDEWDSDWFGDGGMELDPTTGDLGTIPDPGTTLGVIEAPSFDPATGELSGGFGDDFGFPSGFELPGSEIDTPPLSNPGDFGGDDFGGELTTGSGGEDPNGTDWGGVLDTGLGVFGDVLGAFGGLINGAVNSNKGVGSPRPTTGTGSPSAPVNTNPTTSPVGLVDIHAENTTTFLVLAAGLVAFFLIRK